MSRARTRTLALALLAALALTAGAPPPPPPTPIPKPDLGGAEPRVAAKITSARRYVESHPASAYAWGLLAMNLDVHGFRAAALPAYERAHDLDPKRFRWLYYRAVALAETGSPAALDAFAEARRLAPGYAPLLVRQGDALAAAGQPDAAREAYTAAAAADPGLLQAQLGLARLALAAGDLDAARKAALEAVELAPRSGEAHALAAAVERRLGEAERARDEARRASHLPSVTPLADPVYAALAAEGVSSFWFRQRGRAALARGDGETAERELTAALDAAPTAESHDDLGLALQVEGRYAEAAAEHRAALALRPRYAAALAHLGTALRSLGRKEDAIGALERAVALDPDLPAAQLNLGTALEEAGRWPEAAAALRRARDEDPDDPRPAARLAWLLATSPDAAVRDGTAAVGLAEEACRATGDLPEALDVAAAAYAEAGRFDEAAATARRALEAARSTGRGGLARDIGRRLALYERHTPYRQGAAGP